MKTADEVSWCLMAQWGVFLIIVEPVAPEKAGCVQHHPIFPSPPSLRLYGDLLLLVSL